MIIIISLLYFNSLLYRLSSLYFHLKTYALMFTLNQCEIGLFFTRASVATTNISFNRHDASIFKIDISLNFPWWIPKLFFCDSLVVAYRKFTNWFVFGSPSFDFRSHSVFKALIHLTIRKIDFSIRRTIWFFGKMYRQGCRALFKKRSDNKNWSFLWFITISVRSI